MTRQRLAFGARLRDAIRAKGLSQNAFARDLGVTATTLSRWVTGENQPPLETLAKILRLTGLSANALLELPEPPADRSAFEGDGEEFETIRTAAGRVGAGPAILDADAKARPYAFHKTWLKSKGRYIRAVHVDRRFGDSMLPTIAPGSTLAVDLGPHGRGWPELGQHNGKVFLVKPEPDDEHGGMVVKRVYLERGALVLLSDNPQAKPRLQLIPLEGRPLQKFLLGRVIHVARDEE